MAKTLKDTLKEIQILLGKPHKKLAGALKYYLGFLEVKEGEKAASPPQKGEKIKMIKSGKITWTDVVNPTRKEISQLAAQYPFHPLHLEDCLSKGQFPKMEQNDEDKYLFLLLRLPALTADGNIIIWQICFFLGSNYLVSIHENSNNIISTIFAECQEKPEQAKAYIGSSSAHLLYTLINQLADSLSPILQAILVEVDETEDIVFDDKVSGVYKIGQLRRKIISLRRVIGPLRILLEEVAQSINKFSPTNLSVYFENINHQVDKIWESLEEARETVDIYKDADFIISTEKTNRILALLTIIFTLSIPATLIGTFYGMNIPLPGGLNESPWTFFGRYSSFIVILAMAATPAIIMLVYFRKRGWF